MVGLMHRRKLRGTREASNGGRVSHKELTYLLQKFVSYQNKVLHGCS